MPPRLSTRLALATALGALLIGRPAAAQDASELVVRLGRIENQSRVMSGQIETLQYENRQLKEQLRKFQEDVEYRLNEGKGGEGRGGKPAPASGPVNGGTPCSRTQMRGVAFDPDPGPGGPGAPMRLGTTQPTPPRQAIEAPPAPTRLPQAAIEDEEGEAPGYDEPVDLRPPVRTGTTGAISPPLPRPSESVAATAGADPGDAYETAVGLVRARQYEQAEMGLRQFIQSHPRDTRVPGATYWLGESYLARGRNREAAEQFLKVSTDYARAAQAPDAMLKLGVSLNALGAHEQACATLAELERKFPGATANVRQGVAREQKRARCAA